MRVAVFFFFFNVFGLFMPLLDRTVQMRQEIMGRRERRTGLAKDLEPGIEPPSPEALHTRRSF